MLLLLYKEVFYILFGQLMENLWNKVRNSNNAVKTAKWFIKGGEVDSKVNMTQSAVEDVFKKNKMTDNVSHDAKQVHMYLTSRDYQWEWIEAAVQDYAQKTWMSNGNMAMAA